MILVRPSKNLLVTKVNRYDLINVPIYQIKNQVLC